MHIVISTEEVIQRARTVPNRLGPVNPCALARALGDPARIEGLFVFAARLESQDSNKVLGDDRADIGRST